MNRGEYNGKSYFQFQMASVITGSCSGDSGLRLLFGIFPKSRNLHGTRAFADFPLAIAAWLLIEPVIFIVDAQA